MRIFFQLYFIIYLFRGLSQFSFKQRVTVMIPIQQKKNLKECVFMQQNLMQSEDFDSC